MPIRDAKTRERYRDETMTCELARHINCCHETAECEMHHILGGPHRSDILPNLLLICRKAHEWCHHKPIEGRILCWWAKHVKGEFAVEVIRAAWGQCPIAWIEQRLCGVDDASAHDAGMRLVREYR